jgi:hypothetical protein
LGAWAAEATTLVCRPGCRIRPSAMPISTAIRAVMANHSSVRQTRRAAFCIFAMFAMLATMAVNTRAGTRVRSSWMKIEPS